MSIRLLGIMIKAMGTQGALKKTADFMGSGGLRTIAYVSMDKLMQASENAEEKEWWEDVDLALYGDKEVLKAAGVTSQSRIREVEENVYLRALLKRIVKNHYETFLLADTEENVRLLEEELRELEGSLTVTGRDATERYTQAKESLINNINVVAPRVILSRIPYPEGISLMYQYHRYLNGDIWVALPQILIGEYTDRWYSRILYGLRSRLFRKKLSSFNRQSPSSK
ncbi:MAG: hypothetical protein IJC59_07945 [Lachnospiraceae bacterium]|nr:hypothetical protein [Lachnospiraceae bacterium]